MANLNTAEASLDVSFSLEGLTMFCELSLLSIKPLNISQLHKETTNKDEAINIPSFLILFIVNDLARLFTILIHIFVD